MARPIAGPKEKTIDLDPREALFASNNFKRAQPEAQCDACNKPYGQHLLVGNLKLWDGQRYLRKLCDGSYVKLV